ncbi:hypothetical protein BM1_03863 [Bipolaris maydis]|nr:hypothetical protein BM1_03863 [Bipolaris maydis]
MSPTDSLITTTPHLQPDHLPNPQDILVPYTIVHIEEYLTKSMDPQQSDSDESYSEKTRASTPPTSPSTNLFGTNSATRGNDGPRTRTTCIRPGTSSL